MNCARPPSRFSADQGHRLVSSRSGRANRYYGETLNLPPAYEGAEQVGYLLGETVLMLKEGWYAPPMPAPNPRITIATDHAPATEEALGLATLHF